MLRNDYGKPFLFQAMIREDDSMRTVLGGEMEYFRIQEAMFRSESNSTKNAEQLKKTGNKQNPTLNFADMLQTELKFVSAV